MGVGIPPPIISDTLKDILPDNLRNAAHHWDPKFDSITRGDLMRLGGWMPPKPGANPPYEVPPSPVFQSLSLVEMRNLAKILEEYNQLTYGHSVYFCCSCA